MLTPGCYHETSDDDMMIVIITMMMIMIVVMMIMITSVTIYSEQKVQKTHVVSEQKSKRHMLSVNKSPKDSNATL
jgi:heme/copper-type cytochrome/quinol oxidase subunit 2